MQKPHVSDLPIFGDYGNSLQCPSCGNGMLHHKSVLINHRFEDSKTGKSVWVGGISDWCNGAFQFRYCEEANMSLNPSPRRGGILIEFDCECCLAEPQLGIFQHKGWTCIEWFDIGISDSEPKPEPEPIKRKPIKPSLHFEILKRDDYRCQMCGVTAKDGATLEIDHIHPVSRDGTNEPDNLQVLCRDCNAGKGAQYQ